MVPGGRGPGGGNPLTHHPICAGHWPNVRSRPLTRRPTACPATGKHQGTNFTTPRRQRVRAPGVVGRGGRSVAPRRAAASARPTSAKIDGDQLHRAREAASAWSPEGVARAAATHSHTTPSVWAIGLMYGRTPWHDGRLHAPRLGSTRAPIPPRQGGSEYVLPGWWGGVVDPLYRAGRQRVHGPPRRRPTATGCTAPVKAASAWSPEGVARAAATPRAPPHLCGPLA